MSETPQQAPSPPRWHRKEGVMPHVVETFNQDVVVTMGIHGDAVVYVNDVSDKLVGLALRTVANEIDPPRGAMIPRDALWAVLVELVELADPARTVTAVDLAAPCMHLRAALDQL